MIMLDTDTCVFIIRKHPFFLKRYLSHANEPIAISSIVFYELELGILLNRISKKWQQATREFLGAVHVVDFSANAASIAGVLEARRTKEGKRIGVEDAFIAAHAISLNSVLVTANTKHFEGTPGLQLADWSK